MMEDRKAAFLSYLSRETQRRQSSFLEGHLGLGDLLQLRMVPGEFFGACPGKVGMGGLAASDKREPTSVSSPAMPEAGAVGDQGHRG